MRNNVYIECKRYKVHSLLEVFLVCHFIEENKTQEGGEEGGGESRKKADHKYYRTENETAKRHFWQDGRYQLY